VLGGDKHAGDAGLVAVQCHVETSLNYLRVLQGLALQKVSETETDGQEFPRRRGERSMRVCLTACPKRPGKSLLEVPAETRARCFSQTGFRFDAVK
jgi:hypothetical protein